MKYALYILSNSVWQLLVEGSGNDTEVIRSANEIKSKFGISVRAYRGSSLLYSV